MKKLFIFFLAAAILPGLTFAQGATADIYGTVVLPDGSAIPGVAVTLTGDVIGKKVTVTSEQGHFRFLKNPPGMVELKFELEGFKTVIQKAIRLFVGKNKTFNVQMETTKLKEVVEVKGQAGVVDTRKTTVSVNVSKEMIQSLPTARNPWTVMNLVPGMMMDREDVGGNESGQQSSFYGHGGDSDDTTWNVDGANVTDPSAIGTAPAYLNVNAYEELQVTMGSNDITAQTGGVQLNFVSKRAGNRYTGDFHLYVEDEAWEMNQTLPESITDKGWESPGIFRLYQYGINFGGPVVKDKLWFYGSWGVQDIHARTITGGEDSSWLVSAYGKMNFQLGNTSGDLHYAYDAKKKWNRPWIGAGQQDAYWNQDGPGSVFTGSLQHIIGNLMLTAKFAYTDGGFELISTNSSNAIGDDGLMAGDDMIYYYYPGEYFGGGIESFFTNRNTLNLTLNGNYFSEGLLGGDHEIRFGVDYYTGTTTSQYVRPNQRWIFSLDKNNPHAYKEIWWKPNSLYDVGFERLSFYLADTATFGKLTANIGIRYDKEQGSHNDATSLGCTFNGSPIFGDYLGPKSTVAGNTAAAFTVFSPRLSLSYDISGDGRNVVKFSIARYGSQSGNSIAAHTWALADREVDVYWADDGDGIVEWGEFSESIHDWLWWNVDVINPAANTSSNTYAPDLNSPLLDELSLSFEKALSDDLAVSATLFYKKRHNLLWFRGIHGTGALDSKDNWYVAGVHTFESGKQKPYYERYLIPVAEQMGNYKENYNVYTAAQLVISKKFSNKWMFDASFIYQDWKAKRSEDEYLDMTNYDFFNDGVVAPESGGSGITGIFVNSRWMFKMSGLYQLPWGINITGVFQAREGYVIPYHEKIKRGAGLSWTKLYEPDKKIGDDRLPTFWMLSLGLEKIFKVSDTVTTTIFMDAYNVTNNATTLKVEPVLGSSATGEILRVLNPGIIQFGVRVNF